MSLNIIWRIQEPEQETYGEDGEDGEGPGEQLVQPGLHGDGARMKMTPEQLIMKTVYTTVSGVGITTHLRSHLIILVRNMTFPILRQLTPV